MTETIAPASGQPNGMYDAKEPFNSGMLKVSDVHEIYFEESGNPNGKPVVFVHGGPGGGTDASQRCFFNPAVYRIVLFDQRGCGKSKPYASLVDNTTWHLVEDMEKLRKHLSIDKWQVFGGSWGSTLAIAYAETHPAVVTELVLRGIFLVRQQEIDWFYQRGASIVFPDAWEHYLAAIPVEEHGDLVAAYHKRLTGDDHDAKVAAAKAWSIWEGSTSKLRNDQSFVDRYANAEFAVPFARIECHYFVNKGFLRCDTQLLDDVHKIRHIPTVIVQGRYDMVCPIETAWALHRAFPEAEFVVVPDAGHSAKEPGISRALVAATDKFAVGFVPKTSVASATDDDEGAIFSDRDGVINEGINVGRARDVRLVKGAAGAFGKAKKRNKKVIWITNQGGLGEALDGSIHWKAHPLSRRQLKAVHSKMFKELGPDAVPDDVKVCPHSKSIDCPCRKPKPEMILQAAREHKINLKKSYMIGDSYTDVLAGIAAGCTAILVLSGPNGDKCKDKDLVPAGTPIFPSVVEAIDWILEREDLRQKKA
ncbi:MAG: prolyl aminopeptidase [Candidatus Obscuribacterales bacterium]|nr:prolyl aminopeptidase [Candidatus Obscuribacterales bacterium]